jgi:hypothetical protein
MLHEVTVLIIHKDSSFKQVPGITRKAYFPTAQAYSHNGLVIALCS